jgi:hypothetical protein
MKKRYDIKVDAYIIVYALVLLVLTLPWILG